MKIKITESELYQLLMTERWEPLVDFLHYNKNDINKDERLAYIAGLIESEFIRKLKDYPVDRDDITVVLENFYLLNDGNFYKLKAENIELVYEQLAVRYPKQYAHFSKANRDRQNDDYANVKAVETKRETVDLPVNWIEIFNRLFEMMDVREDVETYFSGPRFINLVRRYDRYHPDYIQFIRDRELNGKSTTRKVFLRRS